MLYADMLTEVLSEAEGCPEDAAINAMRRACIAWCTGTYCLTTSMLVTTVDGDQQPGAIDMTAVWPVQILSARIDGEDVDVLAANDPATKDATDADPVLVYANPEQPYVLPPPSAPREVELYLAVAPGPASTEIPDFVWQRYQEHLIDGALSRVLASRRKLWSDPQEAERRRLLFERAITLTAGQLGVNRVTTAQRLRVQPV